MMYYCMVYIDKEEANSKVFNKYYSFVINSCLLLFKFLTSVITNGIRAIITNIIIYLTNLDTYISEVQFDIDKFHLYSKEKCKQLRNLGETSQDILVSLFKVSKMVSDQFFYNWFKRKKENYEEVLI